MAETITRQRIREEASAQLKLRFRGIASGVAGVNLIVVEFSDLFTESMAPLAAYISQVAKPESFRRILTFVDGTGAIVVNRDTAGAITDGVVDLHLIISGEDWVDALNHALRTLYFTDRVTITPVDGQSLYPLAVVAPWIHSENMIERIKYRWTPTGTPTWINEADAVVLDVIEDANTVDLLFGAMPENATDLTIVVEGRHFYEALGSEVSTTTCPEQLINAATRVHALRKVWSIMGADEAKAMFGREMKEAEDEFLDAKKQHIKQVEQRPFRVDKAQLGPEMAMTGEFRW